MLTNSTRQCRIIVSCKYIFNDLGQIRVFGGEHGVLFYAAQVSDFKFKTTQFGET